MFGASTWMAFHRHEHPFRADGTSSFWLEPVVLSRGYELT
jgi:hypothetical protein